MLGGPCSQITLQPFRSSFSGPGKRRVSFDSPFFTKDENRGITTILTSLVIP